MDNKELTGVMFPRKKEHDKQPDFNGSALIGGVEYYVAAWKRTGKQTRAPYLKLAFEKKAQEKKAPVKDYKEEVEQVAKAVNADWEDVPFI